MLDSCDRTMARRARVKAVHEPGPDGGVRVSPPHSDVQGWGYALRDAFGSPSSAFVDSEMTNLANALRSRDEKGPGETKMNAALAVIDGVRPENEVEAMLASQMAVTHALSCQMLGRMQRAEHIEQMNSYGSLATKLQRTFTMQLEALAKLRRKGTQKVIVEHVHVHAGGQAIVGAVTYGSGSTGGGGTDGSDQQTHGAIDARALALAPGSPVLCPNEGRQPVPAAGSEG